MRVKFSRPYRYVPSDERRVTIRYEAKEYTVKREAGEAAVKAGAAKEVKAPTRGLGDWDGNGEPGGDAAAKAED